MIAGELNLLSEEALAEIARQRGPAHVSLFMPTHRAGPETRQDPIRFKNLVNRAEQLLAAEGAVPAGEAGELVASMRDLLDDEEFWQHQADGLAVYAAPGQRNILRLPLAVGEDVAVGRRFRVRPLLPLLADDGHFFVLALSQNEVRLFEATRYTMSELAPGPMPASMAEALALEDREAQLQLRSAGTAGVFHGHGEGGEIDKQALERFFRVVDRGLLAQVGPRRHPVVLAAVGYYLPIYRDVSDHPALVGEAVEGNPEGRSPEGLHADAWEKVAPVFAAARRRATERLEAGVGTGITISDPAEVVRAGREGRVDTLFLVEGRTVWGRLDDDPSVAVEAHDERRPGDDDLLDLAATEALLTGAAVYTGDLPGPIDAPAAALLRW
jgi:hypothetical protein